MSKQSEALRLARELDACPTINYKPHAAELRRLVAENERLRGIVPEFLEELNDKLCEDNERLTAQRDALLEALRKHVELHDGDCICEDCAAIAKAKEQQ